MKLREIWDIHNKSTIDTSNIARQLGFGGIAICYLFKNKEFTFPLPVLMSLASFVIYFVLDLSQYSSTAINYHRFLHKKEKELQLKGKGLEKADIGGYPKKINFLPFIFFYSKITFLFIAFVFLGYQIFFKAYFQSSSY